MTEVAKKLIEIGLIKELYQLGFLTEDEMNLAITDINFKFSNNEKNK